MMIRLKKKIAFQLVVFVLLGILVFPDSLTAQEEIKVGSATREMIVYASSDIDQNRPLVISMHGMNQTMYDQKNQTQFQSVAQANNFVLVFPQSDGSQWQLWGDNDINFILAIIDEMNSRYGIDRDRVYLTGFSMGGMMCYYAATRIADKIAAFGPVSGFLMDGPNTNSSRPVPIIHIHGADDGYVPYSNVQTHIDAWVKRNGCPTTPVITKPYPANVSASLSSKKYYGPGNEGVEVVFISVAGVGHWYSDNNWSADGIFSSQEIWDFCKKFSLKDGVPEFKYASVTENAPSQIQLELTNSIVTANNYTGFTVKIDDEVAAIDNIAQSDTNKLVINLSKSILKDNVVTLSYDNGNVVSVNYEKKLPAFSDAGVDNLLNGAAPRLIDASTDVTGDVLLLKFNKKMHIPSDVSALALAADYNGQLNIPVSQCSFANNDSTTLSFQLGEKVYRDYTLTVSYSGTGILSADEGVLKAVSELSVNNKSNGLPVHIDSGKAEADGISLLLDFSKPMKLSNGQSADFILDVNGEQVPFIDYSVSGNSIRLVMSTGIHYGDNITLSYTPGEITASDNGPLDGFSGFAITNQVNAPTWIEIPGKIEAEDFTLKYGMQAETTGDTGGGQNLGYIGDGNWVEYAINNNTAETEYQISFRLAAPYSGGIIDFYIDGESAGRLTTPNTGNWQVYQSVVNSINIGEGKHYLKVVATKAGFNLNYLEIKSTATGISELTGTRVTICPNPVSSELIVKSESFQHNKIEVLDAMGKLLIERTTSGEPVVKIPIALSNGLHFMRLSNGTQNQMMKFLVVN